MCIFQSALQRQCACRIRSSISSLPLLRRRLCRRPSRLRRPLCVCATRLHVVIHCLCLIQCRRDSAHHTPKVQALIAHGLAIVHGPSDSGKILELTDVYKAAFAIAALKAYSTTEAPKPKLFRQAMSSPDTDKWYKATAVKMQVHLDNGTWELVKLPAG
jgi:hypothetical protein